MAKRGADQVMSSREKLEELMSDDTRALTAQSDRINRHFARRNDVSANDLFALLHIKVAEAAGEPLSLSELRQRMDVSPAAITYLVDRMIDSGHIRRESDPADRRKSLLCFERHGIAVSRAFFGRLRAHIRSAVADLSDRDLRAAHRVFTAIGSAMTAFEDELAHERPKDRATHRPKAKR
jgi:DNA-binding MarR family transcriptional regulator